MNPLVKVFSDQNRDNWEGFLHIIERHDSVDADVLFPDKEEREDSLDYLRYQCLIRMYRTGDKREFLLGATKQIIMNLTNARKLTNPIKFSKTDMEVFMEVVGINLPKYLAMQSRVSHMQPYEGFVKLFGEHLASEMFDIMEQFWFNNLPALLPTDKPREGMVNPDSSESPFNFYASIEGALVNGLIRMTNELIFEGNEDIKQQLTFTNSPVDELITSKKKFERAVRRAQFFAKLGGMLKSFISLFNIRRWWKRG